MVKAVSRDKIRVQTNWLKKSEVMFNRVTLGLSATLRQVGVESTTAAGKESESSVSSWTETF